MKKVLGALSLLVLGALLLSACAPGNSEGGTPVGTGALTGVPGDSGTPLPLPETPVGTLAPTEAMTSTLPAVSPTAAMTSTQEAVTPVGTPAGTAEGTAVLPPTGRTSASLLSVLLTYKVVDKNGVDLGSVRDFIVNVCEAHILYIVLEPSPALGVTAGQAVLIPFEAATLQGGMVDEGKRELVVNFDSSQLTDLPVVDSKTLDLTNPSWESDVIAFWSNHISLSLTTECHVTSPQLGTTPEALTTAEVITPTMPVTGTVVATPADVMAVIKIAYARDLLKAELQDGNAASLGKVEEVILQPESGLLRFVVVRLDTSLKTGNNLVLVPIRAVNLSDENMAQGKVVLVLLVDTQILVDAPSVNAIPDATTPNWDQDAFSYWSQYVPLTNEP